jgi:hypothetical protein
MQGDSHNPLLLNEADPKAAPRLGHACPTAAYSRLGGLISWPVSAPNAIGSGEREDEVQNCRI